MSLEPTSLNDTVPRLARSLTLTRAVLYGLGGLRLALAFYALVGIDEGRWVSQTPQRHPSCCQVSDMESQEGSQS